MIFYKGELVKYNPPHKLTQKFSYIGHVNGMTINDDYVRINFHSPKIGGQTIDKLYLKRVNKSILIEKYYIN